MTFRGVAVKTNVRVPNPMLRSMLVFERDLGEPERCALPASPVYGRVRRYSAVGAPAALRICGRVGAAVRI